MKTLEKDTQVFVRQSDLDSLQKEGVNFSLLSESQRTADCFSQVFSNNQSLTDAVEKFFSSEKDQAEQFLMSIQACLASGGKKLVLEGVFDQQGRCPDIFSDPDLTGLESLKLKGIKELPRSIGNLQSLKNLDMSTSPIVYLPDSFKKLENLESLDLSYSGMTQRQEMMKAGKEYLGGVQDRDDQDCVNEGIKRVIGDLFDKLQPLTELKTVHMKSHDCKSAAGELYSNFSKIGKKINLLGI